MNILMMPLGDWLLTWFVHSVLLIGIVWLIERLRPGMAPRLRLWLWRGALAGALLTATLQVASPLPPLGGRHALTNPHPAK
ncbi:MAG: hypothetical protein PVI56_12020, partial [Gammaproteobacteria bacterium]